MNEDEILYWALEGAMMATVLATVPAEKRARAEAFLTKAAKLAEGGKPWKVTVSKR